MRTTFTDVQFFGLCAPTSSKTKPVDINKTRTYFELNKKEKIIQTKGHPTTLSYRTGLKPNNYQIDKGPRPSFRPLALRQLSPI